MNKIKKKFVPLLFIFIISLFIGIKPTYAYEPVEVKVPFTFTDFTKDNSKGYSLTIKEEGNSENEKLEYDITSDKTQYYTKTYTKPGEYTYTFTYTEPKATTDYELTVFIYTNEDKELDVAYTVVKEGSKDKTTLEFKGEKVKEEEKPKPTPTPTPSKPTPKPDKDDNSDSVQTGDDYRTIIGLGAVGSLLLISGIIIFKKKKK